MSDLENRLRALHVPASPPADDVVVADVRRARVAAGRRRAARLAAGGVGLLAVGGIAATVVVANQVEQPPRSEIASRTPAADGADAGAIRLVDYAGPQQPGFAVTRVPDGFVLQGATPFSLDVARAGDDSDLGVFEGKVVVTLQSVDVGFQKTGRPVRVHGTTGYLRTTEDGVARILAYRDGEHVVEIQSWDDIGLTDAQLVEFADGVTVTSAAQASRG